VIHKRFTHELPVTRLPPLPPPPPPLLLLLLLLLCWRATVGLHRDR